MSFSHSLTSDWRFCFVFFVSFKIKVIELFLSNNKIFLWEFYKIQNIGMLNMVPFEVISVCQSRGQSVTGSQSRGALYILWLIPQEYGSSQKFDKLYNNYSLLNMFTFDVFSICHSLGRWVMGIGYFYILAYSSWI